MNKTSIKEELIKFENISFELNLDDDDIIINIDDDALLPNGFIKSRCDDFKIKNGRFFNLPFFPAHQICRQGTLWRNHPMTKRLSGIS